MDLQIFGGLDSLGDGVHRIALTGGGRAVVKRRRAAAPGFFAMEAYGLDLLRAADTLRVPAVLAVRADTIVLEDLGAGRAGHGAWERAGCGLARMHRHAAATFGLDRDGWCGASPQPNTPAGDGFRFFAECRLLYQGRRAHRAGRLEITDIAALERLCADLRARVPAQPPVLVHGDLWTANLHCCADGELALIDAGAVHYGLGGDGPRDADPVRLASDGVLLSLRGGGRDRFEPALSCAMLQPLPFAEPFEPVRHRLSWRRSRSVGQRLRPAAGAEPGTYRGANLACGTARGDRCLCRGGGTLETETVANP